MVREKVDHVKQLLRRDVHRLELRCQLFGTYLQRLAVAGCQRLGVFGKNAC